MVATAEKKTDDAIVTWQAYVSLLPAMIAAVPGVPQGDGLGGRCRSYISS